MTQAPAPACPDLDASDGFKPLLDRQIAVLGELMELGLEVARALRDQVVEPAPDTPAGAPEAAALAFHRAARAVRLSVMLQEKLIKALRDGEAAERGRRIEQRKAQAERMVARIAEADEEHADQAEDLAFEAGERLEREALSGELLDRPLAEVVAGLCRDIGIEPDWALLGLEPWAGAVADAIAAASPPPAPAETIEACASPMQEAAPTPSPPEPEPPPLASPAPEPRPAGGGRPPRTGAYGTWLG